MDNSFQRMIWRPLSSEVVNFQFLGIKLFTNSTDWRYQVRPNLGVYGGYQYSDRVIHSNQSQANSVNHTAASLRQQSNHQNVGLLG